MFLDSFCSQTQALELGVGDRGRVGGADLDYAFKILENDLHDKRNPSSKKTDSTYQKLSSECSTKEVQVSAEKAFVDPRSGQ